MKIFDFQKNLRVLLTHKVYNLKKLKCLKIFCDFCGYV